MYQRCELNTDCIIAEYVFDNSYNPLTDQICTISIRYPNETLSVHDYNVTNTSYGWHQYIVNIDSPQGIYPSVMCCNNSGDYACIDKTFILGVSFDIINNSLAVIDEGLPGKEVPEGEVEKPKKEAGEEIEITKTFSDVFSYLKNNKLYVFIGFGVLIFILF
ncbi:MAG: hypothetical protein ACI83O_000687 [Patescibacteria group bacterium]|jgi:hypothetical protein